MIFAHFRTEINESNQFVIACAKEKHALLIDAPILDKRIPAFFDEHGLTLSGIFITHAHFDHTEGLKEILAWRKAPVYAARDMITGVPAVKKEQDDTLNLGRLTGRFIALPGHTPCSLGLIIQDQVFTGDALFSGSIGGTPDEITKQQEIQAVAQEVFSLPDHYQLHTGHGPSSTVWVEKNFNPFFVEA